jgi:hypothetical protein
MDFEINGSDEGIGLIMQLEKELAEPIGTKSNLTVNNLQSLIRDIEAEIHKLNIKQQELADASQHISYKQLYDAVVQIKESNADHCPACQTPLSQTTVNPFEHAKTELEKLKHLGELQEAITKLDRRISDLFTRLSQIINTCCTMGSDKNALLPFKTADGGVATINWWEFLCKQSSDKLTPLHHIEGQVRKLEDSDNEINRAIEKRTEKQGALKLLRNFSEDIIKVKTRKETANNSMKNAVEAKEKFDTDNASLIEEVEVEKAHVAQNQRIAVAYTIFVQRLNGFKDDLPSRLVADLGETIVQLYNAFNQHDAEHEQLAIVRLPLRQNQRLEISFKRNPESFFDALHILSEGHIRCLGLAILSAKNIKEGCPLLIFDDPVNAIDDDHRESIRRALFEDKYFVDKQIILACHGEEFFKDIQNLLTAEKARQSIMVSFLPKNDERHLCIDQNCSPRNYVLASRTHLHKSEIRYALDEARKALESLMKDKVWRYVNRFGDGNLSIKLRSPKSPIELRNLTEQLKAKISKQDFSDPQKSIVLEPIEFLLGMNGESREWRYLNKGTHEESDRAEFERPTVDAIITALEKLDIALS